MTPLLQFIICLCYQPFCLIFCTLLNRLMIMIWIKSLWTSYNRKHTIFHRWWSYHHGAIQILFDRLRNICFYIVWKKKNICKDTRPLLNFSPIWFERIFERRPVSTNFKVLDLVQNAKLWRITAIACIRNAPRHLISCPQHCF